MNDGKIIFSQLTAHLPLHNFRRCVARYRGHYKVKSFSCLDQYLCMAFAQLTYRESLRDIEVCLRAQQAKLYHMGLRGGVARNTLANANETRDWRIFADFAQGLIAIARRLYGKDSFGLELDGTVYALDSTTIDLCLSLFPWAPYVHSKAAVKLHTLLDLRGNIPAFIHITHGRWHDVRVLDELIPEPGAFYVMDRGYIHFKRLFFMAQAGAFFVVRARDNFQFRRLYSRPADKAAGVICDQIVRTAGLHSKSDYPEKLRRVRYRDPKSGKALVLLTNNMILPATTIARLYKCRWQVELFFKWIK
jgi:IS4 transposase